jgi:hypothetical protein
MKLAVDGAFVVANVFGWDESVGVDAEGTREMSRVVELVPDVPPEMGYMPSGARDAALHCFRPSMIGGQLPFLLIVCQHGFMVKWL